MPLVNTEAGRKVVAILSDNLSIKDISIEDSTDISGDLGADSLEIMEVVMDIEEQFEITVQDEDIKDIKTVGELIEYISKNQK